MLWNSKTEKVVCHTRLFLYADLGGGNQVRNEHAKFYNSKKWKRKREYILKRDGYLCRECAKYGRRKDATVVHHIEHYDDVPEKGLDSANLVSLCTACHNKLHPEKFVCRMKKTHPPHPDLFF